MSEFVEVGYLSDIPESGKLCVDIDEHFLLIVKIEEQLFCIDDVCTHDGGPLGDGDLDGNCIACPRHGARFDVTSGKAVTMPATEPTQTHEVRIDGDRIMVKLSK